MSWRGMLRAGWFENFAGDLGENPDGRDFDHEGLNVFWIGDDVASSDADGRMAEGTHREVTNVSADRFGVGNDGWTNLEEEFADAFGICFNGSLVKRAMSEGILERFAAEQMKPRVGFADEQREGLLDAFVARKAAQFSNARFHFGEDDFLLIDEGIFE